MCVIVACCRTRWQYMVCIFVIARMHLCMFLYSSVRANVCVCMCARVCFCLHEVTNSRNHSKICFNRSCAKKSWNSRCCVINFDACILKHFVYALLYKNIEKDRAYAHTRWCECTHTHTHIHTHKRTRTRTLSNTYTHTHTNWCQAEMMEYFSNEKTRNLWIDFFQFYVFKHAINILQQTWYTLKRALNILIRAGPFLPFMGGFSSPHAHTSPAYFDESPTYFEKKDLCLWPRFPPFHQSHALATVFHQPRPLDRFQHKNLSESVFLFNWLIVVKDP